MMTESEYIVDTFQKAFGKDRSKRICLYGTGRFTKLLLERLEGFHIVGVADFGYEKNTWEGYRILSKEDLEEWIDILVLIANPANIHLVYKKVKQLPEKIKIYTIEKRDVREEEQFHEQATLQEAAECLKQYAISEEDKLVLERFLGKLLYDTGCEIHDVYSFINIFVAPWLLSYFAWFLNRVRESKAEIVLLPSRDGYLFYRLFGLLQDCESLPKAIYFYTSRRCIAVASIENEQDVEVIAGQLYKGNKRTFLEERFGIKVSLKEEELLLDNVELALRYKEKILEKARMERACLETYLLKEGIDKSKNILLFDFVGRGTIQYCLEKIMGRSLDCLYYFRVRDEGSIERERTNGVISYSGEGSLYMTKLFTQRNQVLFEAIVTAPHGMVERIGKDGNPFFRREKIDKSYFAEVEKACMDYYKEMCLGKILPEEINLELVDRMVELIEYDCIFIDEKVKRYFTVDDPYQNMHTNPFMEGFIK